MEITNHVYGVTLSRKQLALLFFSNDQEVPIQLNYLPKNPLQKKPRDVTASSPNKCLFGNEPGSRSKELMFEVWMTDEEGDKNFSEVVVVASQNNSFSGTLSYKTYFNN